MNYLCYHLKEARIDTKLGAHVHLDGSVCAPMDSVNKLYTIVEEGLNSKKEFNNVVSRFLKSLTEFAMRGFEPLSIAAYTLGKLMLRSSKRPVHSIKTNLPRGTYGFVLYIEGACEAVAYTLASTFLAAHSIEPFDVVLSHVLKSLLESIAYGIAPLVLTKTGFAGTTTVIFEKVGEIARGVIASNSSDLGLNFEAFIDKLRKCGFRFVAVDVENLRCFSTQ